MSWITTPRPTAWPFAICLDGTLVTEPQYLALPSPGREAVRIDLLEEVPPARRKGAGYDWTVAQRAALLALPGASEHGPKPRDWREQDARSPDLPDQAKAPPS